MDTKFLNVIKKVLNSDLLDEDLIDVPGPSTDLQIKEEESKLQKNISSEYKIFLQNYNGLNLDVIRFYGVGKTDNYIKSLSNSRGDLGINGIAIGDDPAGFFYIQNLSGHIYSCDSKSGDVKCLSNSFSNFVSDVIFGKDADKFAGSEWKSELYDAGIF